MLDLVGRTAAFRLRNEPEGYDNMMQKVQETPAGGCLQVENDRAIVVEGETCWKQTTVGRCCYAGLIGSMRMCRR